MSEGQKFLRDLEKNEDDVALRMVYADWLEENNEPEEAERQRRWPESKAWLVGFLKDWIYEENHDNLDWFLRYFISQAKQSLEAGHLHIQCGDQQALQGALLDEDNGRAFWEHMSVLTGVPLPDDFDPGRASYSCAC